MAFVIANYPIRKDFLNFNGNYVAYLRSHKNCTQRAGIADGGEFYIRPPGTAAWLFDKVKY